MKPSTLEPIELRELLDDIALTGRLFGTLLSNSPDRPIAVEMIAAIGKEYLVEGLRAEYQRLFIGPEHFRAPAWGSVYLDKDSVLFGSSTQELRAWMRKHDISASKTGNEPEDQIGKMLLLMAWLAEERPKLLPEFLSQHLMTWAPRYLELLKADSRVALYRDVSTELQEALAEYTEKLGVNPVKRQLFF
ncbi:MAG: Tat proofreading chaperone DmsD [Coriobacteriales bacterium]|nr:Tat proofreading chaperone DmsD [Coriobacteriales bacterium]